MTEPDRADEGTDDRTGRTATAVDGPAPDAPASGPDPSGPGPGSPGVRRRWWSRRPVLVTAVLLVVAAVVAALVLSTSDAPAPAGPPPAPEDPLARDIAGLQERLASTPDDAQGWATLGLDYVQQAKNTVNPMYYPKAEGALDRSLSIDPQNYVGLAGTAALRAAQHRFGDALALAQQAQALAPANSTIYGTLADAYTQLGRYDEARDAAQRMLDLRPGTPSFTRGSYVYELAGDVPAARDLFGKALEAASSPSDRAFCRFYLSELAFNAGDPAESLRQIDLGVQADPTYPDLLAGRAKAEAALGQTDAAVADYARVVATVPQPQYLIEAGEYLESIGRVDQARADYRLFDAENALFTSNGVQLDTDPTLYYADHGDPAKALQAAEAGIRIRPFLEMHDAYAWALHVNGRDAEALDRSDKALATGMRNALFRYHRGMIEKSLGRTDAARADLTEALAINPNFSPRQVPVARAALAELGGPR